MENNQASSKFPADLLEKPIENRKAYFEHKIVQHPKLDDAFQDAKMKILENKTPLVLLYGPSGVGKSTLLIKLQNEIILRRWDELLVDKGRIPVAYFEAKAPEAIKFNWGDFYRAGLKALKDVSIDKKIIPAHLINNDIAKSSSNLTVSALRWAYESALTNRTPDACIVDEAQHIARVDRGSKVHHQLDVIKSIANITKTPHILAGTYDILQFRNQSAQLTNRSTDVHLARYKAESKSELLQFKTVIATLNDHLPVEEVDLLSQWRFLYERSIGCIGVLKLWLLRALDLCLNEPENHGKKLTESHLELTALKVKQCAKMLQESRDGENQLLENDDDRQNLITSLGLNVSQNDRSENKRTETTTNKNSNSKPFQRKPTRDAVGVTQQNN